MLLIFLIFKKKFLDRRLEYISSNVSIDGNYTIIFEIERTYRERGHPMRKDDPFSVETTDLEIPKFSHC